MKKYIKVFRASNLASILILGIILSQSLFSQTLFAASVTTFSDTLTRIKASTAADHEILFLTPTGVTTGQTLVFTFAGFTGVSSLGAEDFDLATGSTSVCSSAVYTEQNVQASNGAAVWGVGASGSVVTFTAPSAGTPVTANKCVRIRIGLNATDTTGTGPGNTQISNSTAGTATIALSGGTFADSGTTAISIIANDQVVVTATVDPTFTFSIDDNAIGFGSLSSSLPRYASADGLGSGTDVAANTFTIATNASFGYTLTYNGPTLTSGLNSITAATITGDADGTPGTEQFAISAAVTGTGTAETGYDHSGPDWNFNESSTSTLASATTAASDSIDVHYLANISGATAAGAYTTTLTYIATGNF